MANYFTEISKEDGSFVGIVYDENTTEEVFRTNKSESKESIISEVNIFLLQKAAKNTSPNKSMKNTVKVKGNAQQSSPPSHVPCNTCGS